jgi:hypothetical protein
VSARPLPLAAAAERLRGKPGRPKKRDPKYQRQQAPLSPRLLDVEAAGSYLGVSAWTVRDLLDKGTLARVRIPLPGGGQVRRLLLDRQELDGLVARWHERA